MTAYVNKRLFMGFICLHILHHAAIKPFFGTWMMEELAEHGYKLSPGTLYPILHTLQTQGLLRQYGENCAGKIRKYYEITEAGKQELYEAKRYLKELVGEIGMGEEGGNV